MARGLTIDVAVDDLDDPRFAAVAETAGYSAYEAWGRFLRLWAHCLKRQQFTVHPAVVRQFLGPNGVEAILQGGVTELALGREEEGGIYVCGSRERLGWLSVVREGAAAGGRARSAAPRSTDGTFVSETAPTPARRQPLSSPSPAPVQPTIQPTPAPSPSLSLSRSSSLSESGPPVLLPSVGELPPQGGKPSRATRQRSKVKPGEATADEHAAARRVLEKLGARNGVKYETERDTHHIRLVVRRMRDLGARGRTLSQAEWELRLVVGYCAIKLKWEDDPKASAWLNPDTLFGVEKIEKYLAPARSWWEAEERDRAAVAATRGQHQSLPSAPRFPALAAADEEDPDVDYDNVIPIAGDA